MAHGTFSPNYLGECSSHLSHHPPMLCCGFRAKKKVISHNHSTAVAVRTSTLTDDYSLISRILSSFPSCSSNVFQSKMIQPRSRVALSCPASFHLLRSGIISSYVLDFHGLTALEDGIGDTGRRVPRCWLGRWFLTMMFRLFILGKNVVDAVPCSSHGAPPGAGWLRFAPTTGDVDIDRSVKVLSTSRLHYKVNVCPW